MKISSILALGLTAAALATAGACGGTASGRLALGIKDGPPTSSDGRTITKLEIDISKIELKPHGEEQNQTGANEDKGVVVLAAGTPHTIDLLKVTTFSEMVANITLPAGTYDGAELVVNGARVVFADAPTVTVPLVLGGDGHSKAQFEFHFKPAVVVSSTGSTLAVIDFLPMVIKDGTGQYRLDHDGINDQSGEANDNDEFEVVGSIATLDLAGNKLTLSGTTVSSVDVSAAKFEMHGAAATKSVLAVGQKVQVEGTLDKASGTLIAAKLEVE